MKLPEFTVSADGGHGVCVNWQDKTRRYHVWLDRLGRPQDDILHSNPIQRPADGGSHRALSLKAKKWAPLIEALLAEVKTGGLIAKARQERADGIAAEQAKRAREYEEKRLAQFIAAFVHLPPRTAEALRALPVETKLAFLGALE